MDTTLDSPSTPETTTNLKPTIIATSRDDLESLKKSQTTVETLSSILPSPLPPSLSSSKNPAFSLLHDSQVSSQISTFLRQPNSGAGDNHLCRWLYDTFQSSDANLQLVVLRFLPIIAGVYLSRVALHKPLAGFEAVLLALYAHETTSRNGQSITVNIPDLSHSSIYHETTKSTAKNCSTELNLAVISASLEPHDEPSEVSNDGSSGGSGGGGGGGGGDESERKEEGRIPLPWELLQPILRILGHCLMGPNKDNELHEAAWGACRSLYARSLHDVNPKAILATGSLLRLVKIAMESNDDFDPTELSKENVLSQ
ncbi:Hyccin [Camellia lanceoleosa]|uniref:Hyccin n=1 Tax=Camellia lanceoleosa TaxID=1840588 RepID=A0ACC0F822_9ERIC|nr:Hyccin [Camellia lanceoleosa]